MSMTRSTLALAGICGVVGLGIGVAAQTPPTSAPATKMAAPTGKVASAKMMPTQGSNTRGELTFTQDAKGIHVTGSFTGLAFGEHGFHIHEKGDCSAADGTSAGGHFNPANKPHGDPAGPDHHGGDMPMLVADAGGSATLDTLIDTVTIGSGAGDIVGRAVIVHQDADDFRTQPTGNSGARVACGVIVRA